MNHEEIIKEQDEQLNEIESSVKRIKQNAKLINQTIDDQKVYIQEMNDGMDQTQKKNGNSYEKNWRILANAKPKSNKTFSFFVMCCYYYVFYTSYILIFNYLFLNYSFNKINIF